MNLDPNKVAMLTTVSNFKLYHKSLKTFPAGIQKFVVDGTKGFYGLKSLLFSLERLKDSNVEWLVMADEDVIFKNPEYIYDLIHHMTQNNFVCCGMRDGGTLGWRNQSPYAINTFFSILDLSIIRGIYNRKEILKNQYIKPDEDLGDLSNLKSLNFNKESLFEEYYCFYFWLLRMGKKILYLDATALKNDETTIVFDHNGREILYHTWYARFYEKEKRHTERIDGILDLGKNNGLDEKYTVIKNSSFQLRLFFYTYIQRIRRHWNKLMSHGYRA